MKRIAVILAFASVAVVTPAAVELTLEDGRVLQGVDLVRKGDSFLLELENGKTTAIPAQLVEKVALTDDSRYTDEGLRKSVGEELAEENRDPDAPTALRDAGPETLAGRDRVQDVRAPKTADQVRVLGDPSRFPVNVIDPVWIPESEWSNDTERQNNFDPSSWSRGSADPRWRPSSAYVAADDVMAQGDSDWRESIVDPEWDPEDGFEPRNEMFPVTSGEESRPAGPRAESATSDFRRATFAGSRRETPEDETSPVVITRNAYPLPTSPQFGEYTLDRVPEADPETTPMTAERCASRIVEEQGLDSDREPSPPRVLGDGPLGDLPASLHEIEVPGDDDRMRVVFAVSADDCRAVAGDFDELLEASRLGEDHALAWSANAFNTALQASGGVAFETVEAKIDYARAVARLLEPGAQGGDDPSLLLVRDDLERIVAGTDAACKLSKRARRREARAARQEFREADATIGVAGDVITFFVWRRSGGVIARYAVYLSSDGLVTFQRSIVAAHVGDHDDPRAGDTLHAGSNPARGR